MGATPLLCRRGFDGTKIQEPLGPLGPADTSLLAVGDRALITVSRTTRSGRVMSCSAAARSFALADVEDPIPATAFHLDHRDDVQKICHI